MSEAVIGAAGLRHEEQSVLMLRIRGLQLSPWEPDDPLPRIVLNGTQVGTDRREIGPEFPRMLHPMFPDFFDKWRKPVSWLRDADEAFVGTDGEPVRVLDAFFFEGL